MKLKYLVIVIILLFISFNVSGFFIKDLGHLDKSTIDFNGDIFYVGGTGPNNYTKIQDAIDNASAGDTIFVYNGIYEGGLVIDKSIILRGENREYTIIDGVSVNEQNGISIIGDGVILKGFTIRNMGKFWPESAIYINCYDTIIADNIIRDNKFGIDIYESENTKIINNMIVHQNRYDGIYVRFSSNNFICNNLISDNNGYGIILVESSFNFLYGNTIANNNWGGLTIQDEICIGNLIYNNNFFNNQAHNSWDVSINFWNNSYSIGGNFWDDYNGVDEDGDGIGDTPYFIDGGDNMDYYPLINPYINNFTTLEISGLSGSIFKILADMINTGDCPAIRVEWSMSFEGGFVLLNRDTDGHIDYIIDGESKNIQSNNFIGFGRTKLSITVKALNVKEFTEEIDIFLFFIFIIIK